MYNNALSENTLSIYNCHPFLGCVQDLKKEYHDSHLPITDDSLALHKLCAKLEYLLQIDMKGMALYMYTCVYIQMQHLQAVFKLSKRIDMVLHPLKCNNKC